MHRITLSLNIYGRYCEVLNCMINVLSRWSLRGKFYAFGWYNFTVDRGRGESSPGKVGLAAQQGHSAACAHPAWASGPQSSPGHQGFVCSPLSGYSVVMKWPILTVSVCAWLVPACSTCSCSLSLLICFVILDVQLDQNGASALIRCSYLEITHFALLPTEVAVLNMSWLLPYLFSKCHPRHTYNNRRVTPWGLYACMLCNFAWNK